MFIITYPECTQMGLYCRCPMVFQLQAVISTTRVHRRLNISSNKNFNNIFISVFYPFILHETARYQPRYTLTINVKDVYYNIFRPTSYHYHKLYIRIYDYIKLDTLCRFCVSKTVKILFVQTTVTTLPIKKGYT